MENLGIDYKLLIAQIVNFGLLFFVVSKYVAKPFLNAVQMERRGDVEKERILKELQTKEERMLEEEKKWNKSMKEKEEKILNDAKKKADAVRVEILAEAKSEADSIVERGKKQVEEERESFYREAKKHIANVSVLVIEKALDKYLTTDVQKKLTEHVLSNMNEKNNLYEN